MTYTLLAAMALSATAASAQSGSRSAADAANAFSLNLPSPAPSADAPRPGTSETPTTTSAPTMNASYTLETPIAQLVLDSRAKAVLDRDLPGLSDDPNLAKFSGMSLHQFQPMTGGQLTNDMLTKVAADLAALGGSPAVAPSLVVAPTRDRRMDSGR